MGIIPLRQGLKHYSQHGELPSAPIWNRVERSHDMNPGRFAAKHPMLVGMFETAEAPGVLPDTPYWNNLRYRHELNPKRFEFYHPFLGKLVERDRLTREQLSMLEEGKEPETGTLVPPPEPGGGGGGGGGGSGGGGGGGAVGGGAVVPEPASVVLVAMGLLACGLGKVLRNRLTGGDGSKAR